MIATVDVASRSVALNGAGPIVVTDQRGEVNRRNAENVALGSFAEGP